MMRPLALALLLALLLALPAAAQPGRVTGTVRDTTGGPLPGVNVVLAGTTRGAATDAGGAFAIDAVPPGAYVLRASALGFAPFERAVTVPAGGAVRVDLVLREAPLASGEVVVTASRRAQSTLRAPASVAVLGADALAARGTQRLDDGLRHVPGVTVNGNQLGVRGSSGFSYNVGSRVLLLVDGATLLAPDAGGIPFDVLPVDRIERIEVVKGPGSALYGGGALGGVVGVFTRDAPDAPTTTVRLHGGAYEPFRHAAWRSTWSGAERPRPLGGVAVTHARRAGDRLGGWATLGYRADAGYLEAGGDATLHAFGKLRWRPRPRLGLDVLAGFTRRRSDSFLYWNGLADPLRAGRLALFGDEGTTGSVDNRIDHLTILPTVTHTPSAAFTYAVRGRFYRVVSRPLDDDGRPRPLDEVGTVGYRYGAEGQATWARAPFVVTAGASGDAHAARSDIFLSEQGGVQRGQPEGAAFVQVETRVTRRLDVTAGLRLDGYAPDDAGAITRLSPKLSAVYAPTDALAFRAAWGLGFRVPTVAERFTSDDTFLPILSNLGLRPEESAGAEAGVRGAWTAGGVRLGVDAALFHTTYDRLIEPAFVVDTLGAVSRIGFRFINLTAARIRGVDARLTAAWRALEADVGYTLLDTWDRTADAPLVFRNRHLVVAALTAGLGHGLSAGLDLRLASRPERVDSDFARFVPDAEVRAPVRVLDVRGGWRGGRVEAVVAVRNALDYYYVDRPALLAPPRHVVAEVTVRL